MKNKSLLALALVGVLVLTMIPLTGGFAASNLGSFLGIEASSDAAIPEDASSNVAVPEDTSSNAAIPEDASSEVAVPETTTAEDPSDVVAPETTTAEEPSDVVAPETTTAEDPSDVVIPEYAFVDSDYAKVDKDGDVVSNANITLAQLLACAPEGAYVEKLTGEKLADDKYVGSGMKLILPDGTKYVIIVYGDATSDGKIKSADARLALRRSVDLDVPLDWLIKAVDIDGNEGVKAADARLILRAAVGLEEIVF